MLVRRDATPPSVTASVERSPDSNGWYNRPVTVTFTGDDGGSGIASCTSATYSGPDAAKAAVGGTCTDNAGNQRSSTFELAYDATPPAVEAKPERPPNAKGWYNRAVTVGFEGADPMAGVHACTPPVTYQGPDAPSASLSGICTDKASNTSQPTTFQLKYDTKPPSLGRVKAEIGSRGVVLRWTASKDADSFAVVRRPGLRGKKPSPLFSGRKRAFTDRRLQAGVKYRYTVTAYDEAGNAAVKAVVAQVGRTVETITKQSSQKPAARPALTRPAAGARVSAPPRLAWKPVQSATYYNVQLYRNGRKILTAWPSSTSFALQRSWRFAGRVYRLTPGRYTWYVWPGLGRRSASRYGKLVGSRGFVVTR